MRDIVTRLCGSEKLSPAQVVILSCRSAEKSVLSGEQSVAGFRLAPNVYPPPKGSILVTSLLRYKGLEADAVIVTDIHQGFRSAAPVHLYVAASRARHRLFLVGSHEALDTLGG